MPLITNYDLIAGNNAAEVSGIVTSRLEKGWHLYEGPSIGISESESDGTFLLCQAVVEYAENVNPDDEMPPERRFCIIDSWDTGFIEKRANELLSHGWLPTGNLVYRCNDQCITEEARHYYAQAFYLPPEVLV